MKDIDKELDTQIADYLQKHTTWTGLEDYEQKVADLKQLINKARMDSLDQFTKDFNIYASEHREQFSLESIGMIWGLLAKQQIPLQDRLKELKGE